MRAAATYWLGSWEPLSLQFKHQETILRINLEVIRPKCRALVSSNSKVEMDMMLYHVELERLAMLLEASTYKSLQRNY